MIDNCDFLLSLMGGRDAAIRTLSYTPNLGLSKVARASYAFYNPILKIVTKRYL